MFTSHAIRRCISESFSGRISVVTGAGGGIGRAASVMLAEKGSTVVSVDLNEKEAKETQELCKKINPDVEHLGSIVDVTSRESVETLFATIEKKYSKPATVVVNCAGILKDAFILKMSEEDFQKVISVNLIGTFLITKIACQYMVKHQVNLGSIVNISSVSGKIGNMGQCNYAASKAGVEAFTRSVSKEMAQHNIRCNAIMPGFIETQILSTVPPKVMEKIVPSIPMKRLGQPDEIAEAILFLSSERASYITGCTLEISGGLYA